MNDLPVTNKEEWRDITGEIINTVGNCERIYYVDGDNNYIHTYHIHQTERLIEREGIAIIVNNPSLGFITSKFEYIK